MKKYYSFMLSLVASLCLVACQEEDFGVSQEQVFRSSYERNFTNTFGNIPSDQDWDFSGVTRGVTSFESIANQHDEGRDWFLVPDVLLNWMKENLKEGQNNSFLTTPFAMVAQPDQVFEIVPIYFGHSGDKWTLHIVAVDPQTNQVSDMELWSSANANGQNEPDHGLQTYNGGSGWAWYSRQGATMQNNTTAVRALPVLVDCSKIVSLPNTPIYFYMERTDKKGNVIQRTSISENPCLSAVNFNLETAGIDRDGYDAKLIAFNEEEITKKNPNPDYNDIVLLIAGFVPQLVQDEVDSESYIKKRYLIEDLGSTSDFDFNDVVVDVTQTDIQKFNVDPVSGVMTPITEKSIKSQEVKIRYLCGTLPIQVKVGSYTFGQITNPANKTQSSEQVSVPNGLFPSGSVYSPKTDSQSGQEMSFTVSLTDKSWNAETNNISVSVWKEAEVSATPDSEGVWKASYPMLGSVPYIIAVPQTTQWTAEGVKFPWESYANIVK